jgi:hypothetical protein
MKIDENKLKTAIRAKFGTQVECANKLGVKEGVISRAIKSQSPKSLEMFKKGGIDIDALLLEEEGKRKGNLEYQLNIAEKRIKELEEILEQKDNLIKSYELIFKSQLIDKK